MHLIESSAMMQRKRKGESIIMKQGKYEIRPIRKTDDSQIAAIVRRNLENYGLNIPGTAYFDKGLDHLSRYYAEKAEERAYFVLTDSAGKAVGGVGFAEFSAIPGCAELQKLYLDDSVKGLGFGKGLLETAESFAACMGYTKLYLETHSALKEARHLYEKMGYQRIPRPDGVLHSTMDCFYLKNI